MLFQRQWLELSLLWKLHLLPAWLRMQESGRDPESLRPSVLRPPLPVGNSQPDKAAIRTVTEYKVEGCKIARSRCCYVGYEKTI